MELQHFLHERMILTGATAHPVDEVINLIDKSLEHRTLIVREKRQQLPQRAATGLGVSAGEGHEPALTGFAVLARFNDLLVDDGGGV
jgi:hypothetical protein